MNPERALREIAFWLERASEPTFRVRAFRTAAAAVEGLDDLGKRVESGRLTEVAGIGTTTARVIEQAHRGRVPDYLHDLRSTERGEHGRELRAMLRGDCHTHSDWSDGGSSLEEMAATARALGHEWMALTDHSPRLTVARGLSTERLLRQLDVVVRFNENSPDFRVLTGIEVDILEDGRLDQDDDVLSRLDVVVASAHSRLRMGEDEMTRRLCAAVQHPHVNVLGHCTGRLVAPRQAPVRHASRATNLASGRPDAGQPDSAPSSSRTSRSERTRRPSAFDAERVFDACRRSGVAVEINSRPERLDPPRSLLRTAVRSGCEFAIDSDAHAPGQLDWLMHGCVRAQDCGITADRVINAKGKEEMAGWVAGRG